jgi:hypothetical protein
MYRKQYPREEWKENEVVNFWTWQRITKKFNERKMESVIKGHIFNMPYRLGSLGIVQFKRKIKFNSDGSLNTNGLVPHWPKTYAMWRKLYPECETKEDYKNIKGKKVIFITNEHTDGRIFKFHWKKKYINIRNISAYELNIAQRYKRALARLIMENNNIQYCTKF